MNIGVVFTRHSQALFDPISTKTFGGAEVQMFLIAKQLQVMGNNVSAYVPNCSINNEEINGISIIKTFVDKNPLLLKILKFHRAIKKTKPDVIIQHGLTLFSCLLAYYCKKKKITFVYMFASDSEAQGRYQRSHKKCRLFRMLLRYADLLVTQNAFQKKILQDTFKAESVRINNGFELPADLPQKNQGDVLWVARADPVKQPEIFLQLAEALPQYTFCMICPRIDDHGYFEKIKMQADHLLNVTFKEFIPFDHINEYFEKAYLFVNTSSAEGYPQTFIQATIAATPIISLHVNPDTFITTHACGIHCSNSFEELKQAVISLHQNDQYYKQISKNCFMYAREHHDIADNVSQLLQQIRV